jgi:hypothetical protein
LPAEAHKVDLLFLHNLRGTQRDVEGLHGF